MNSLIGDLKYLIANPAEVNVVDSEDFHKRVCDVFDEISGILQKSAGPCGAPTVISNMPSYHITKDGYTIAKNILYDNYKGYLDQVITYMITDICERLNNIVGDGTTAAILCTNKMFQAFSEEETAKLIRKMFFLPRDVIYRMQALKTLIINKLMASARNIKDLPADEMVKAIREVVYISSNGNDATANMIASAYKAIGSPAIRVESAKDGITKCEITHGFEFKAQLTERLYINSDAGVLDIDDVSILMFDYKVGTAEFQYVISPVFHAMKQLRPGKRLLILAPSFDTVALRNIAPSLNAELAATGTITLVMAVYPNATADAKKAADDFSMLTDMSIITEMKVDDIRKRQVEMLQAYRAKKQTTANGDITNSMETEVLVNTAKFILGVAKDTGSQEIWPVVGHADCAKIGMDTSVFSGFHYNMNRYKANLMDAEKNYEDACNRYRITGSFNFDIDDCLARLNKLRLKTAVIYVGSDTEFSMQFDKDAMDDAVRAAQSAYFNGTVIGEHISMMQAIKSVRNESKDERDVLLLDIMECGFREVNHAILENGFANSEVMDTETVKSIDFDKREIYIKGRDIKLVFPDKDAFDKIVGVHQKEIATPYQDGNQPFFIYDFVTEYELETKTALDLNAENGIITFNTTVTNSAATDREILTAAIDLVGLLLTSNQLIIARPNTN